MAIFQTLRQSKPLPEIIGAITLSSLVLGCTQTTPTANQASGQTGAAQTVVQDYLSQLKATPATTLKSDQEAQVRIQTSTLDVLNKPELQPDPSLDWPTNLSTDRKGEIVRALIESNLVQGQPATTTPPTLSLADANLRGANLRGTDLTGADLRRANLRRTDLFNATLSGATLEGAKVEVAVLVGANLTGANLTGVNLTGADLRGSKLNGANLSGVTLTRTALNRADLTSSTGWTTEQLSQARLCRTILPEGANLDPDRDCKAMGVAPEAQPPSP